MMIVVFSSLPPAASMTTLQRPMLLEVNGMMYALSREGYWPYQLPYSTLVYIY